MQSQTQTQLVNLPRELLIHVLAQLDLPALAACHQVCKLLHNTLLTSTLLQYRALLLLHGFSSSSPSQHTPSSATCEPTPPVGATSSHTHPTLSPSPRTQAAPTSSTAPSSFAAWQSPPLLPRWMKGRWREWIWRTPGRQGWSNFTLSPSEDLVAPVQKRPATQQSPNFQIHLLTLSSALPHPSAQRPILTRACRNSRPQSSQRATAYSYGLQICGEALACLFLPREQTAEYVRGEVGEELVIWDWKTGALRAVYMGEPPGSTTRRKSMWADPPPKTFSFLDEDTILVAGMDTGALEICTIPSPSNSGSSTNSGFSSGPSGSSSQAGEAPVSRAAAQQAKRPQLIRRVRLLLPALRPSNATILSILTRSNPSPGEGPFGLREMPEGVQGVSTSPGASASTSAGPSPGGVSSGGSPKGAEGTGEKEAEGSSELFYPSPTARLLTISLSLDSPPDTVPDLTVFILFSTLLATFHSPQQFLHSPTLGAPRSRKPLQAHYDDSHDEDPFILVLPWPTWSSHARATTKAHEPHGYVCYTHGYRYITSSLFIPAHLHAQAQQAGLAGLVAADALEGLLSTKVEVWGFNPAMVWRVRWEQEQTRGRAGLRHVGHLAPPPSPPHGDEVEAGGEGQWAELAQLVEEGVEEWLDTDEEGSGEDDDDEEDEDMVDDADRFEGPEDDSGSESPAEVDPAVAAPQGVQVVPDPPAPRLPAVEQLLLAPATISAQNVFVEPVQSGLTAVVRTLEVPGLLSGLFIDGECIIMLIQRGGREILKVEVF
ncbi:hypothetical protein CALVIDRAFT_569641 [Calocera viscosa TUFC12733]|uniref:F-box domain-containing protein n=1 Tax=Calocera viscosa (strain TUFC12733) TaxID=1330018 RepID=A0A167FRD4_CALVF|nr:hypothetical protein CALVIDRAFT_569641 [Calocera viscosa TUFC12733]